MNIDYGEVFFVLPPELVEWFRLKGGPNWFQDVDPFLQTIRSTFNGECKRVELCRTQNPEQFRARLIPHEGGESEQIWQFAFGRNARFSQVRA